MEYREGLVVAVEASNYSTTLKFFRLAFSFSNVKKDYIARCLIVNICSNWTEYFYPYSVYLYIQHAVFSFNVKLKVFMSDLRNKG